MLFREIARLKTPVTVHFILELRTGNNIFTHAGVGGGYMAHQGKCRNSGRKLPGLILWSGQAENFDELIVESIPAETRD